MGEGGLNPFRDLLEITVYRQCHQLVVFILNEMCTKVEIFKLKNVLR